MPQQHGGSPIGEAGKMYQQAKSEADFARSLQSAGGRFKLPVLIVIGRGLGSGPFGLFRVVVITGTAV
jgi:hypothetical protein